VSTTSRLTIIP